MSRRLWVCPGQGCVVWLLWDASSWSLGFGGSHCFGVLVSHASSLSFSGKSVQIFSARWNNVRATATLCARGWCDWKSKYLSVCVLFRNTVVVYFSPLQHCSIMLYTLIMQHCIIDDVCMCVCILHVFRCVVPV